MAPYKYETDETELTNNHHTIHILFYFFADYISYKIFVDIKSKPNDVAFHNKRNKQVKFVKIGRRM
jgi:hypothetical protein